MNAIEIASVSIGSAILICFMGAIVYTLKKQGYPREAKPDSKLEARAA